MFMCAFPYRTFSPNKILRVAVSSVRTHRNKFFKHDDVEFKRGTLASFFKFRSTEMERHLQPPVTRFLWAVNT